MCANLLPIWYWNANLILRRLFKFTEDFANDVELTEEQQILLLEEYEREIASKKSKSPRDPTNNNTKRETRDKQNNKTTDKKQSIGNKNKNKSPVKKTDECGNNLVEDYFGDKEQVKDDASANSDESWEKEFEFEEPLEQKAWFLASVFTSK